MAREYKKVFDEIRRDTEAGKIEKQLDKVSPKFREQLRKELEEEARKKKQQKGPQSFFKRQFENDTTILSNILLQPHFCSGFLNQSWGDFRPNGSERKYFEYALSHVLPRSTRYFGGA